MANLCREIRKNFNCLKKSKFFQNLPGKSNFFFRIHDPQISNRIDAAMMLQDMPLSYIRGLHLSVTIIVLSYFSTANCLCLRLNWRSRQYVFAVGCCQVLRWTQCIYNGRSSIRWEADSGEAAQILPSH